MDSKVKARSGLSIFFVMLIAGSAYFEHRILVLGGSIQHHLGLIAALVWWVTVSSIVASCLGVGSGSMRWSEEDLKQLELGVVAAFARGCHDAGIAAPHSRRFL